MTTLVVDNIGLLATCDPTVGEGPLGLVRDAAVIIAGERVLAIEPAGAVADEHLDAAGACVIPGFVDSHTHLVFAGDRGDEFAARMAGRPYQTGGINTTVAATRAATSAELAHATRARRRRALAHGITTTEIKSGYGLSTAEELRCLQVAAAFTEHATFLGAHVVPAEFSGRSDDYVRLVCEEMVPAVAGSARWIDAFCEVGAFDVDQCRAVLTAGRTHSLGCRLHGNQLGHSGGVQLAVEMGCASVDHCTFLDDDDIAALGGSDTVATLLPLTEFSTRQPYPNARRLLDAGVRVALATNCNPGSSYSSSMPLALAMAVRDMYMTAEEALLAATVGGALALRDPDVGQIRVGGRADLVVLDAPSYTHLVYRPGEHLIGSVIARGRLSLPASSPG